MSGRRQIGVFLALSMAAVVAFSVLVQGQASASRDIGASIVAPGDTFTVSVDINVTESITGFALSEDVPSGWSVTPIDNDGATYKASANEWLWLSASAGSKEVTYRVQVPSSASPGTYCFDGSVLGAIPAFTASVSGDACVTILPTQYTLTMSVSGSGSTTPSAGPHTYDEDTVVPLTATPAAGWLFDHWSGSVSGSANPTSVTMTAAKSVTAHFVEAPPTQYTLTMAVSGSGSTTPSVGSHTYDEDTVVPLTATPASDWLFDHWSGSVSGSTNPTSVTMTAAKSVTAHFVEAPPTQYTLTMAVSGSGSTTPSVGSHTYDEDTVVPLTATPAAGWLFDHWSGSVSGSANPTSVTMTAAKSVTAHFVEAPPTQYTLTMAVSGSGSTTPSVGSHTYDEDTVVPLTATPASDWLFDHWSGSVSGSTNPTSVTMTAAKSVTAHFVEAPPTQYTLTMAVSGSGSTTPSAGPHTYDEDTVVPLTATPAAGWLFDHWSGSVSGSTNPTSVTMTESKSARACFKQTTPPVSKCLLKIIVAGEGSTSPCAGAHLLDSGSTVTVTATPAAGWAFDHWSGDLSGTETAVSVTINSQMQVTAHFVASGTVPACCTELSHTCVGKGWHLISLPGLICPPCSGDSGGWLCCALRDDMPTQHVHVYSPSSAGWLTDPCLANDYCAGMGFALWSEGTQRIDARLGNPDGSVEIGAAPTWALIAVPFSYSVSLDDIRVIRGSRTETLDGAIAAGWIGEYGFEHSVNSGYQAFLLSEGVLEPWQAYWFRILEGCTFVIPARQSNNVPRSLVSMTQLRQAGVELPPDLPPPPGD